MLSKDTFLNHLYGGIDEPEQKIIDVFMCKLRRKLADAGAGGAVIDAIWGQGYILREMRDHYAMTAHPVTPHGKLTIRRTLRLVSFRWRFIIALPAPLWQTGSVATFLARR